MKSTQLCHLVLVSLALVIVVESATSIIGHVWEEHKKVANGHRRNPMYKDLRSLLAKRAGFYTPRNKWTNGIIPVKFSDDTTGSWKDTLQGGINIWAEQTCLQFPQATGNEPNWIYVDSAGSGCSSSMGMGSVGAGRQTVNLGSGCKIEYTVLHEFAHAIGYMHEYWRSDRENYITFNESLMEPGEASGWAPYSESQVDTLGLPYDYASIMHPGQKGNGIVISKDPYWQNLFGSFWGLSYFDIKATNKLYQCDAHCGGKECPGQGFADKNCVCQCPGWPIKPCDSNEPDGPGFECKDYDSKCGQWKDDGWCDPERMRSDKTMREDCKETCGVCDYFKDVPPACYDLDVGCPEMAASGLCTTDPDKAAKCQRSCKLCSY